jgi:D-serine deaminase-like pyridoxal phosphate-dependent protein
MLRKPGYVQLDDLLNENHSIQQATLNTAPTASIGNLVPPQSPMKSKDDKEKNPASDTRTIMAKIAKHDAKSVPRSYRAPNFSAWEQSLKEEKLTFPVFALDLDAVNNNRTILADALNKANDAAAKKGEPRRTLRLATKSVRLPDVIAEVVKDSPYQGVMCHSIQEANILHSQGIQDILIAYPAINQEELKTLRTIHESGAKISIVVDSELHLEILEKSMIGTSRPFPLVIDMDMSLRYLGGLIHLGTHRTPVRTMNDLETILKASQNRTKYPSIKVVGVMAYDAVVAGLADRGGSGFFNGILNRIKTMIRNRGISYASEMAAQIPPLFKKLGIPLEIFNGGGTGSFTHALDRPGLTEVTAGSAINLSHRFDGCYSSGIPEGLKPGIYQVLQVTRTSDPQPSCATSAYITCQGGGVIASGPPENISAPIVAYPRGLTPDSNEGFGEVQTPLQVRKGEPVPSVGSLIFTRPSKAGEPLAESDRVVLMSDDKVVGYAKTTRGFVEEKTAKAEASQVSSLRL